AGIVAGAVDGVEGDGRPIGGYRELVDVGDVDNRLGPDGATGCDVDRRDAGARRDQHQPAAVGSETEVADAAEPATANAYRLRRTARISNIPDVGVASNAGRHAIPEWAPPQPMHQVRPEAGTAKREHSDLQVLPVQVQYSEPAARGSVPDAQTCVTASQD